MAKKNEYNYFDLKAKADKKSRGNFVLNLGDDVEKIIVKPFTVNKVFKARKNAGADVNEQMRFAFGEEQWDRLIGVCGEEEMTVLQEVAQMFSQHFFGDVEGVDGGKEQ